MSVVAHGPLVYMTVLNTVLFLSFQRERVGKLLTQIRLAKKEQSDQGLHCLPFLLQHLGVLLKVKPHCTNFRNITAISSGVRFFPPIFTVHDCFECSGLYTGEGWVQSHHTGGQQPFWKSNLAFASPAKLHKYSHGILEWAEQQCAVYHHSWLAAKTRSL